MQSVATAATAPAHDGRAAVYDVFISHSSDDVASAKTVCQKLEEAGFKVWIAPRNIREGSDYGEAILDAIAASRFMMVLISSRANRSPHVVREVERAVAGRVTLIPVRLEDVEPSGSLKLFLSIAHWLNAFPPPIDAHVPRIIDALRNTPARLDRQGLFLIVMAWLPLLSGIMTGVVLVHRAYLNLTPWPAFLIPLVSTPQLVLPFVAAIVSIFAYQFYRKGSARGLFGLRLIVAHPDGVLSPVRLVVAWGIVGLLALLILRIPPTFRIELVPDDIDRYSEGFKNTYTRGFSDQKRTHYLVTIRTGRLNPPVRYEGSVGVTDYAGEDGVEFAAVYVDSAYPRNESWPLVHDESAYFLFGETLRDFAGGRQIRFTARRRQPNRGSLKAVVYACIKAVDHQPTCSYSDPIDTAKW